MELLVALSVGVLVGAGVYLLLRARSFPVVLGVAMLGYAANLFLFASGRLTVGAWPILSSDQGSYPDPLPQALVLTAIVIGFGMTAFLVVLTLRARVELGTDHVDGTPTGEDGTAPDPAAAEGGGPRAADGGVPDETRGEPGEGGDG